MIPEFEFVQNLRTFVPVEYYKYLVYLPYFILAFLSSVLLTPIIGYIAKKLDIYDYPAKERRNRFKKTNKFDNPDRHIHKKKKPFLGGLAVLIPLILFLALNLSASPAFIIILVAVGVLTIGGILDDILNLPATIQFAIQFSAALIIVLTIADLNIIQIPFDGTIDVGWEQIKFTLFNQKLIFTIIGDLILILWILSSTNAVKWVCGSDALMEGTVLIAFFMIFLIGVRNYAFEESIISIIMAGGLIGFIIYNYPPAKIFTGATGKTVYGFLLATLAIMNQAKIATTMIILVLPFVDFVYVLIIRAISHKTLNPLKLLRINELTHLHHRLMDLGFDAKQILFIEMSVTLIVGSIGVLSAGSMKFFIILLLIAFVLIIFTVLEAKRKKKVAEKKEEKAKESPEKKYSY